MQTRTQFFGGLTPLTNLPDGSDTECPICSDDFVDPVAICPGHIFCKSCIVEWLSKPKCKTCAICRRVLFTLSDKDRWRPGVNKIRILAQTIEYSRLLTGNFDTYGYREWTTCKVHKAAARANDFLAAEDRPAVTPEDKAIIDIGTLGPHIIAMANMLEGYSRANGRRYSASQYLDWKIIVERINRFLSDLDGWTFEGDNVVTMARYLRLEIGSALRAERFDVGSSKFLETDASIESPSGDLDTLLDYIVFRCIRFARLVEEYEAAQREALQNESTKLMWTLRWTRQHLLGGL